MLQKLYRPRIASKSENRFDINLNCQLPRLDIFLNTCLLTAGRQVCSVSVLTFIGQVRLVGVGTHKLLILPFFNENTQKRTKMEPKGGHGSPK